MNMFLQGPRSLYDFETVTVDNTSGGVGLTSTKYSHFTSAADRSSAKFALVTVEGASVRWVPGTTPAPVAATTGHLLDVGTVLYLEGGAQLAQSRFIRETATSGTLQVSYFN